MTKKHKTLTVFVWAKLARTVVMKILFFISSLLLVSLASSEPTYQECFTVVTTISDYLTSPEILDYQVGVLLSQICPQAENPDECVLQLPAFWNKIAMVIWPWYYNPQAGWMCGSPVLDARSVTCDCCLSGIQASIDQLISQRFVSGIMNILSGGGFCGMEEDADLCASTIEVLIPLALPAIASVYNVYDIGVPVCNTAIPGTC